MNFSMSFFTQSLLLGLAFLLPPSAQASPKGKACQSIFAATDTDTKIPAAIWQKWLGKDLKKILGTPVTFESNPSESLWVSEKPQEVRAFDSKTKYSSLLKELISRGNKSGHEWGLNVLEMKNGETKHFFYSSNAPGSISSEVELQGLDQVIKSNKIKFEDIAQMRRFHTHPSFTPLSDPDWYMMISMYNTLNYELALSLGLDVSRLDARVPDFSFLPFRIAIHSTALVPNEGKIFLFSQSKEL